MGLGKKSPKPSYGRLVQFFAGGSYLASFVSWSHPHHHAAVRVETMFRPVKMVIKFEIRSFPNRTDF